MPSDEPCRRDILQTTAGLVAGGTVVGAAQASDSDITANAHDVVPTTPEQIRAAFDDVPRLEHPTDAERRSARVYLPEVVVPESGPIPDPQQEVTVTLDAPPWLLASTYAKSRADGAAATYQSVEDTFLSRYQAWETWRLPDGTDAVEAVLEVVQEESDA